MEPEALKWLQYAETDLNVAKHLNTSYYPKPLEIICYHCEQASEKSIKAVIVSLGAIGGMPKNHNLSFLLTQIKNMVEIPEELYDSADILTPYGISVRYPNELYLEERHVIVAIENAEKIYDWAKNLLEKE